MGLLSATLSGSLVDGGERIALLGGVEMRCCNI